MKLVFCLGLVSLLASALPVGARLLENLEECDNRYASAGGAPAAEVDSTIPGSDPKARVYSVETNVSGTLLRIVVEFKEGKAWYCSYSSAGLSKDTVAGLRDRNKGDSIWSEEESYAGRKFWITKTKDRIATEYLAGQRKYFEVMTKECAAAVAQLAKSKDEVARVNKDWSTPSPEVIEKTDGPAKEGQPGTHPSDSGKKDDLEGL